MMNKDGLALFESINNLVKVALTLNYEEYPLKFKTDFGQLAQLCQNSAAFLELERNKFAVLTQEIENTYFTQTTILRENVKYIQKIIMESYKDITAFTGDHQSKALNHFYKIVEELFKQNEFKLAYETLNKASEMRFFFDRKRFEPIESLELKIFQTHIEKIKLFHDSLPHRMKSESHYNLKKEILDDHANTLQWMMQDEEHQRIISFFYNPHYKQSLLRNKVVDSYYALAQKLIESSPACALEVIEKALEFNVDRQREFNFRGLKLQAEFANPSNDEIDTQLLDIDL